MIKYRNKNQIITTWLPLISSVIKKKLFPPNSSCAECKTPLSNLKKIVCIGYKLFQKIKVLDKDGN